MSKVRRWNGTTWEIISDNNHTHTKANITDFTHTHTKANITDFTHTHTKANITDFTHTHAEYVPINGTTMTGQLIAQSNTSYTTKQVRNIILSTTEASLASMADGDIWIKYI